MCGIIGLSGHSNIHSMLIPALETLQHRGQDAAGVVVSSSQFYIKKGLGLVSQVFNAQAEESVCGSVGIGHVRYTTQGANTLENAQPFIVDNPIKIAMAHNGNVTNFQELKQVILSYGDAVNTDCDLELLIKIFSIALSRVKSEPGSPETLFEAVKFLYQKAFGAYSVVAIVKDYGLLGFTDLYGIRPLFLGAKEVEGGSVFCFSSETRTFDRLGFKTIQRLTAGQAIFIDKLNKIHINNGNKKSFRPCVFEDIYFSKPDSQAINEDQNNQSIAEKRRELGKRLAKQLCARGLTPDVIIDVPSSAYFYAEGLSQALNVPYQHALRKNHSLRTFITDSTQRDAVVNQKFIIDVDVVKNKKVAVVDDSIVRGTISKYIVAALKAAGAKEVYFISGSPMVINPCTYGVDMSSREEMASYNRTEEEIALFIGADQVIYPTLKDLYSLYHGFRRLCDACFSGQYPTNVCDQTLKNIAEEKKKRINAPVKTSGSGELKAVILDQSY